MNIIKYLRYGTPKGDLWHVYEIGESSISYALHPNKLKAESLLDSNEFTGVCGKPNWIYKVGEYYLKGSNIENNAKCPMLVVGTSAYIRNNLPFYLLQHCDIYLFFAPTNEKYYRIGCIAFDRTGSSEPVFSYSNNADVTVGIKESLYTLVHLIKPITIRQEKRPIPKVHATRMLWWANWIYRCPKIALKDVMTLESFKNKKAS